MHAFLADAILILHFLYIAGLAIPVPLLLVGYPRGWRWLRRPLWRKLHLAAILFLITQTALGFVCPFTEWEWELRRRAGQAVYEESFVEHWVGRWVFFEWDERYFAALYLVFSLTALGLYWLYPPEGCRQVPRKRRPGSH